MKNDHVVVLDGAVGTSLWKKSGDKQPVWTYNIDRPEIVTELTKEYVDAGADIVLTNSFAANRSFVSREKGYNVKDVIQASVKIATDVVKGSDVRVMFTIGPLMDLLEPYGSISAEAAEEMFDEQISAAMVMEIKPDIIYVQTFIDLAMAEIAVKVAEKYDRPIFCTMSFDKNGMTIMGNSVDDFITAMNKHPQVDAIGLNCNITPAEAVPVIQMFEGKTDKEIVFKPNAGKPKMENGKTIYEDAFMFVRDAIPALDYGVKYIGGCCGTDPTFIKLLREAVDK
jgi:5-methyltetrahydrofolate--homocysteine methyltransferase